MPQRSWFLLYSVLCGHPGGLGRGTSGQVTRYKTQEIVSGRSYPTVLLGLVKAALRFNHSTLNSTFCEVVGNFFLLTRSFCEFIWKEFYGIWKHFKLVFK